MNINPNLPYGVQRHGSLERPLFPGTDDLQEARDMLHTAHKHH